MSYTVLKSVSINKNGVVKFSGYINNVSPKRVESWEWMGGESYEDSLSVVFNLLVDGGIQPMASSSSKIVYAFYKSWEWLLQNGYQLTDLWGENKSVREGMYEKFKLSLKDDIVLTKKNFFCKDKSDFYVHSRTKCGYRRGIYPKPLTYNMAFNYALAIDGIIEEDKQYEHA